METPKIFESEYRFCLVLWENEPVNSTKLAQLCKEKLGWSKATTYTVIRRLAERGVLKNENATQEEVDQAVQMLNDAMAALKPVVSLWKWLLIGGIALVVIGGATTAIVLIRRKKKKNNET